MTRTHNYPDFQHQELTFLGETRSVYIGGDGPAIVVMHEVPGLYPEVAEFARKLIRAGYRVYMPSLIGTPGKPYGAAYSASSLMRACVASEFATWALRKTSPITKWLRELARHAHEQSGGLGVGAVGMCLTGGFALAMMVDEFVKAPVLSQPSLPLPVGRRRKRDIGISDETLAAVKARAQKGQCVLGLRFTEDMLTPGERFATLRDQLGDKFIAVEIDSSAGNPHGISRRAHSVLVHDFVDEPGHPTRSALDQVMTFFAERLTA